MRSILVLTATTVLFGAVIIAGNGQQQPQSAQSTTQAAVKAIDVPQGNGVPVITDGVFTPGEWDDALRLPIADDVTIFLKEYRGVVFLGLRGVKGPEDMWVATPGGPIEKLHVSFALIQVPVPPTGPEPKARLGFTTDWYANELRRDEDEFQRMLKEGRDGFDAQQATTYPLDGIEYAIRRAKFPGRVWLLRLWVPAVVAGKPLMFTYPPSAAERVTDGWLELRFK